MGLWGVPRGTVDVDLLIDRDDLEKVDAILTRLGYRCEYRTKNVSQYVSPEKIFGEIDCLHAFRATSMEMLKRAVEKEIFEGMLRIRVLLPEDLIGLKIQAVANNESRKSRALADIEMLMGKYRSRLDWDLVKTYFSLKRGSWPGNFGRNMGKISKEARKELIRLARDASFLEDMRKVSSNRHDIFGAAGGSEADTLVKFLTEYNEFLNHQPKPFQEIVGRNMKL